MTQSAARAVLVILLSFCAPGFGQDPSAGSAADTAPGKPEAILFEPLPVVEAASLHAQTLLEAPASVTVITDEEIRQRDYRTLADALNDVPGMYVSYARAYYSVGVRGFSIPGDDNTRFLLMVNGHSLIENVFDSAHYFGEDFGLDLDLIKRIEIVRGPSSALYGTNGMFATINIVTKSPVEFDPVRVTAETDNFGERKVQVSGSHYLGRGANLLMSTSVFNNSGQDLYFPAFDTPQTNHGLAVNLDGEKGYHVFANLIWHNWSFLAYFNDREKIVPTGWYGSLFNDPGTKVGDGRNFVESAYERNVGAEGQLRWRIYYDGHRFTRSFDLPQEEGIVDAFNVSKGDSVGTQVTYRFHVPHMGFVSVGSEASWDLRALMQFYYVSPAYTEATIDRLDRSMAVFFQDEWQLSRRWTLDLGGRMDDFRNHRLALTPRVALIYQPSEGSAVKMLYGNSFRNPSSFEQFYQDGMTQIANPGLQAERMQTFEVVLEHRFSKRLEFLANTYQYRLDDLITAAILSGGIQQFHNVAIPPTTGVELESKAQLASWLKIDASLSVQRPVRATNGIPEANSPARVGKLLLDMPLFKDRWSLSGGLHYLSDRQTLAGSSVPAAYLVDLVLASRRLPGGLEIQCGAHNLLNSRYWDPVGPQLSMDRVLEDGRNVFVRLSWAVTRQKDQARESRPPRQP